VKFTDFYQTTLMHWCCF